MVRDICSADYMNEESHRFRCHMGTGYFKLYGKIDPAIPGFVLEMDV